MRKRTILRGRKIVLALAAAASALLLASAACASDTAPLQSGSAGISSPVIQSVTVNTEVEIGGQRVHSIDLALAPGTRFDDLEPKDFLMTGRAAGWNDPLLKGFTAEISDLIWTGTGLTLSIRDFPVKYFFVKNFEVSCSSHPELQFTEADVTSVVTPVADEFADGYFEGTDHLYHLFTPKANRGGADIQPFPIIVVFHGYMDTDNLLTYRTSVEWAEEKEQEARPCYVLSPRILYYTPRERDEVYEAVHAMIEKMTADGEVDADRVYVMGNSFGGAAALEFIEKYPDFAAAGIPLCPALEYVDASVYKSLKDITHVPLFFAHALSDQTIPSGVSETAYQILEKTGAKNNHLRLYTDEEMIAAGGDPDPDSALSFHHVEIAVMPDETYHEWLFEQHR